MLPSLKYSAYMEIFLDSTKYLYKVLKLFNLIARVLLQMVLLCTGSGCFWLLKQAAPHFSKADCGVTATQF